jgi:hypothetical protein
VSIEFQGWPKTPRLFKPTVITEKIDGTNACVVIEPRNYADEQESPIEVIHFGGDTEYHVYAQSRKRLITPEDDNYGFAKWVQDNAANLVTVLGPGRHFGEWWGLGIQRGYDMDEKRFSLFNTDKWAHIRQHHYCPAQLHVMPVIYRGTFDTEAVEYALHLLDTMGSYASPGFMDPEGVIVYHSASRSVFKATLEDDAPKGGPRDEHENVIPLLRAA